MPRTRYSKVLHRLAQTDPRISEYEYDPGSDCGKHWLHLKWPYLTYNGSSVHENTVKEVLDAMSFIYNPEETPNA